MGKNRKKGRQCGGFTSKAHQALYHRNFNEQVNEYLSEQRQNQRVTSKKTSSTESFSLVRNNNLSNQKRNTNLTQLQGLLQERLIEDRARDSQYRRRLFTVAQHPPLDDHNSSSQHQHILMSRQKQEQQIGWILTYNHREEMAGLTQNGRDILITRANTTKCPTLVELSIKALSNVIQEYVEALGVEYMRERIGVLPNHQISSLSAYCRNVTDEVAAVLANHDHLEQLVLCGPNLSLNTHADDDYGDTTSTTLSKSSLTDAGIQAMMQDTVPSTSAQYNENDENQRYDRNREDVLESWEHGDFHLNHIVVLKGCHNLKRLELRNYYTSSAKSLIRLMEHCPQITHLCLSESLDGFSGPEFLFLQEESKDHDTTRPTKTLLYLLKNLQVLDVSNCKWINYEMIKTFLRRICNSKDYINQGKCSLDMICVAGCPYLTKEECEYLNEVTRRNPLISFKCHLSNYKPYN